MIYTFPVKLAEGKHWKPRLAVAGVTTALVGRGPWQGRMVRRNSKALESFNNFLSENTATGTTLLTPALFYAAGPIKKDS